MKPESGCPPGAFGYSYNTRVCYCEPHCRWDMCRLYDPPNDCLIETGSKWIWDKKSNYWVAQLLEGHIEHGILSIAIFSILALVI